jgi:predicted dehydrogenase
MPAKIAIVGTGGISKNHAKAVQSLGERAQLVAALDIDAGRVEKFCSEFQIPKGYTDLAKLLDETKPDLVNICTPPGTHCKLSIQCMEAGAWVLCEKPLCGSLHEMDLIEETERKTGKYCSSVFQWRFGSGAQHVRGLMQSQAFGKPLVGICQTTWYRAPSYYEVPWRGKWTTELGGPTMSQGIHTIDLFLWLLGDWKTLHATIGTLDRKIEVEDTSLGMVHFENGAMGSIVNSILCPRQETYMRLDFQKCTVELRGLYSYTNENWSFSTPNAEMYPEELEKWKIIPSNIQATHAPQIAALLDSMEKKERPLVSGREARRTIEFLTSYYKSALTGETVKRGSIAKDDPFYQKLYGNGDQKSR